LFGLYSSMIASTMRIRCFARAGCVMPARAG
jgi:hypothetical protein